MVEDVTYDIIVTDSNGDSATLNYAVQGKTTPPDKISNLTCTEIGSNVFSIISHTEDMPIDFKEFVIYLDGVEVEGRQRILLIIRV